MEETIVRMKHMRSLAYCSKGVRDFFAKHDLDYVDFIQNGISAQTLLEVSNYDHMVQRVVEVASNGRK